MGIQVSELNNEIIKTILKEKYNKKVIQSNEINRGTANIYKIETEEGNYILKEFSEGRTKESIIKEINIINFLKERNVKVPIYIKTLDDKYYIEYKDRVIILQEYIDGFTMENNTGDYNKTIESAKILGKLTKELKDYEGLEEDGIIERWFSKESIEKGINKMKKLLNDINEDNSYKDTFIKDINDKIKISEELVNTFDFNIVRKMTILNAHGDFSVQQLIYKEGEETTVIDFETAKKLPIVWEVIRSYSYIDKQASEGNLNIDTLVEYFKEFYKYIKLNEYDLKYAAHIYLIQIISSVFGYKQYNNDYSLTGLLEFALFRTKLCRFLYNNIEEISDRLMKEVN